MPVTIVYLVEKVGSTLVEECMHARSQHLRAGLRGVD